MPLIHKIRIGKAVVDDETIDVLQKLSFFYNSINVLEMVLQQSANLDCSEKLFVSLTLNNNQGIIFKVTESTQLELKADQLRVIMNTGPDLTIVWPFLVLKMSNELVKKEAQSYDDAHLQWGILCKDVIEYEDYKVLIDQSPKDDLVR
ncbi:hypothetical protein DFA_00381 [Cavenderia fasciculata]|uniref:Uncharacterized protein n=1 Tax=Cavenderia fasciculata TaxID=261658 RepID=F4PRG8_CACFS|nr:uncharacterized protein DFA_00381 [Cavenderia fasciculata]EGG20520.1 hypothetical protein DFA_00381 [Cavenderia fasciculata]|eukprot:XP_004358370.1 hypothetical protein DFA_00381 [Cavenderia fasciculata]